MPSETSSTAWDSIISRQAVSPPILSLPKGAWLAVQVLAHNLARWAARIGLGEQLVTTKTLRRRFFSLARTAYPLGAQIHFASSPGLALG